MGRLFSPDTWVGKLFTRVGDLMILNFLFLLGCVPVLSIGASFVGLYSVAMKLAANRESGIVKPYFKAWKESFGKGLVFELIFAAAFGLVWLGLEVIRANPDRFSWVFNAVYLLAVFLLALLFVWIWPLEACFENSIGQTLKNAVLLGLTNLGKSVCMVLITLVPLILALVSLKIFLATSVIWFLFGFSGLSVIKSVLLNKALRPYLEPDAGESAAEEPEKLRDVQQPEEIAGYAGILEYTEEKQEKEISGKRTGKGNSGKSTESG